MRINKPKALRRDCIYYIEIVLEIYVSGVYLHSTNIGFARVCSNVDDLNNRHLF